MIFCCRIPLSRLDVQPTIWRDQNSRIADNDASARSGTQVIEKLQGYDAIAGTSSSSPSKAGAGLVGGYSLVSHSGRNDNIAVS